MEIPLPPESAVRTHSAHRPRADHRHHGTAGRREKHVVRSTDRSGALGGADRRGHRGRSLESGVGRRAARRPHSDAAASWQTRVCSFAPWRRAGTPGGLARTTAGLVTLLDGAGRDVVIIETVGVGQSEVAIARLAQATVLVLAPGSGDEVQAMKAGIMEIADVFVINKADLPGVDKLAQELHDAAGDRPVLRTVAERRIRHHRSPRRRAYGKTSTPSTSRWHPHRPPRDCGEIGRRRAAFLWGTTGAA